MKKKPRWQKMRKKKEGQEWPSSIGLAGMGENQWELRGRPVSPLKADLVTSCQNATVGQAKPRLIMGPTTRVIDNGSFFHIATILS